MFLLEVYQVMQIQEYSDTLFTEAVEGFTKDCVEYLSAALSLESSARLSSSGKGGQVFLSEESVIVSWCSANMSYIRRRESSLL